MLANSRENRDSHIGFVGYNESNAGNKILIAIDVNTILMCRMLSRRRR